MKTRDEISAMLSGFVDAKPDEQGTLIAGLLDEFDEALDSALGLPGKRALVDAVNKITVWLSNLLTLPKQRI